jgi:predicted protein tyrosine phosphatase
MKRKQRILCVCRGGNVRSVHLAYLLKYRYGFDALAAGHEGNTKATLALLCKWADMIIIVQPYMQKEIQKQFHKKLSLYDIGEDRWKSLSVEMLGLFDGMIKQSMKEQE